MTDFTLPPFVVDFGGWWIDVDLDGDLAAWARRSAEDVLARWGVRNRRRAGQLAAMLEAAGAATRERQQGAISAMLLYPALGEGIRAGVLFFVMSCTFQSLAEAGQWRSAVDELAASAQLDQTAATPAS